MFSNSSCVDSVRRKLILRTSALGLTSLVSPGTFARVDETALRWTIREGRVMSPGVVLMGDEGTLHRGFQMEAAALAVNSDLLPKARLTLDLQGFRPAKDMGQQKADRWYVKGEWRMDDLQVPRQQTKRQWNRPGTLGSTFLLETLDNPVLGQHAWTASFELLPGHFTFLDPKAQPFQVRGRGELSMNAGFEGALSLALR